MRLNYITKQGVHSDMIFVLQEMQKEGKRYALLSFRPVSAVNGDRVRKLTLLKRGWYSLDDLVYEADVVLYTGRKQFACMSAWDGFGGVVDLSGVNNSKGYFVVDLSTLKGRRVRSYSREEIKTFESLKNSHTAFRLMEVM